MKRITYLLTLSAIIGTLFSATAQEKAAAVTMDAQQMALQKTAVLNSELQLTMDQQNQVIEIIAKYDDINTMNGTTPYAITEAAEREVMEILTAQQQDYYERNMDRIRTALRPAPVQNTPVQPSSTKKKTSKPVKSGN
jgi:hypothetical protein